MKISKLFHWLYGILMLLPILVFIPNAFYYGFNEQAVAQEKTEQVPVYYESNEVNSIDDLVEGNCYRVLISNTINTSTYSDWLLMYKILYIGCPLNQVSIGIYEPTPYLRKIDNSNIYQFVDDNRVTYTITTFQGFIDFTYKGYSQSLSYLLNYIIKCPINYVKEYLPLTTNMSITESMSYAWDSVWQNDLFSWPYESFLAEPFKYIGNVFGLPNDNSIYYCLSYWLDISIIWLCFDLIMYVPLLVHRWIDKGVLE